MVSKLTQKKLSSDIKDFLASGGAIEQIPTRTTKQIIDDLKAKPANSRLTPKKIRQELYAREEIDSWGIRTEKQQESFFYT